MTTPWSPRKTATYISERHFAYLCLERSESRATLFIYLLIPLVRDIVPWKE